MQIGIMEFLMTTKPESLIDALTRLTCVIKKDWQMRSWFEGLAKKSVWDRRNAILAMCSRVAEEGDHLELIESLKMLTIPKIFDAARIILEGQGIEMDKGDRLNRRGEKRLLQRWRVWKHA